MDDRTARRCVRDLATLIGEIMEDHVGLALVPPRDGDWPLQLRSAGEDIATLSGAIAIVLAHAETASSESSR